MLKEYLKVLLFNWFKYRGKILYWAWTAFMLVWLALALVISYLGRLTEVSTLVPVILTVLVAIGCYIMTRFWNAYEENTEEKYKLEAQYVKLLERRFGKSSRRIGRKTTKKKPEKKEDS